MSHTCNQFSTIVVGNATRTGLLPQPRFSINTHDRECPEIFEFAPPGVIPGSSVLQPAPAKLRGGRPGRPPPPLRAAFGVTEHAPVPSLEVSGRDTFGHARPRGRVADAVRLGGSAKRAPASAVPGGSPRRDSLTSQLAARAPGRHGRRTPKWAQKAALRPENIKFFIPTLGAIRGVTGERGTCHSQDGQYARPRSPGQPPSGPAPIGDATFPYYCTKRWAVRRLRLESRRGGSTVVQVR